MSVYRDIVPNKPFRTAGEDNSVREFFVKVLKSKRSLYLMTVVSGLMWTGWCVLGRSINGLLQTIQKVCRLYSTSEGLFSLFWLPVYLLFPMSMMTILELEC